MSQPIKLVGFGPDFTFKMSETQARRVHQLASSECSSLKNHIASAVERGDLPRAQELVAELRCAQALFAAFNMTAKHEIAQFGGKPLETEITVQERSR